MLGNNFIKNNIEEVNQSEAGTDRVIVTRLQKRSYTLSFRVTDFWKQKLLTYGALNQVTFQVGTENTLNGRFRVSSSSLVQYSNLASTPLWTVQATFTQI